MTHVFMLPFRPKTPLRLQVHRVAITQSKLQPDHSYIVAQMGDGHMIAINTIRGAMELKALIEQRWDKPDKPWILKDILQLDGNPFIESTKA